jgi:transposase-like protein
MNKKNRNVLSGKQKAKVALETLKGNKTVNEIAQAYDVHPTQIGLWKKAVLARRCQSLHCANTCKLQ